nr:hypothetical protein [Yersinia frederiksenii]
MWCGVKGQAFFGIEKGTAGELVPFAELGLVEAGLLLRVKELTPFIRGAMVLHIYLIFGRSSQKQEHAASLI